MTDLTINDSSPPSQKEDNDEACDPSTKKAPVSLEFTLEVTSYLDELHLKMQEGSSPTVSQLKMLSVGALEQLLRMNRRPCYNKNKPELATMVTDYIKNGCPPVCPKCKRAPLRFSNGRKQYGRRYYWCPGSTNNGKHFYGCNFKAKHVERIPWKYP